MSISPEKASKLVAIVRELSQSRGLSDVINTVREHAREFAGSDGISFVLRDEDCCFYAEEDAIQPLWKGQRFPIRSCISGWAMLNKQAVVIEDVYQDSRIPQAAYQPTFVKSLAMVPIRANEPIGAIGVYWARNRTASSEEIEAMQALADTVSVAIENVQLYESLKTRVAELDTANRMKDEFLTVLSHELRTPMNAIVGWSQLMLNERQGVSDELRTGLETIDRNARSQIRVIEDLLDISRIIANRLPLEKTKVELNGILEEVVDDYGPLAAAKSIRIGLELKDEPKIVFGDRERLKQIFGNLLSNAIKFSSNGSEIGIAADCEWGYSRIRIIDHGFGIDQEFLSSIFGRFRQADSSTARRHDGLGLGLAIAKHLTEAHGGRIAVESAGPGKGSVFTVYLSSEARQTADAPKSSHSENDKGKILNGVRVLAVDDSPDAVALVRVILKKAGANVTTCESASSAFSVLLSETADVLVCDLSMPEEDGFSFVKRLRAAGNHIPAIALTALADKANENEALKAGFDIFLTKPMHAPKLIESIRQLLPGFSSKIS